MRAVGYIRVSTEEQSREGVSLEMQQSKIRAYAELNDLELVEIIEDAGISGKSIKARPGIQKVIGLGKAKQIDAVIIYKLDRLARNTVETLEIAETLDKKGVGLHSITEKLDTKSPLGRFFFTMLAALAEMERQVIAERTKDALSQKKSRGEKLGGQAPYGYREVDGKLEEDPVEQRIIARVNELRAAGYSYRKIADTLTTEGIQTRKGTPFRETQIIRMLKAVA